MGLWDMRLGMLRGGLSPTWQTSKWKCEYSQMVYYVRVRMAIAAVYANSLLIHGSRDRQQPWRPLDPEGAALGDRQTWQDN